MMDIQQNTTQDSSYSFKSNKYWCHNCQRQFTQICLDDAISATPCPRCNSLCQEIPEGSEMFTTRPSNQQPNQQFNQQPTRNTYSNTYTNNQNRQNTNFTQSNRAQSGSGFAQSSRPANGPRTQRNTGMNIENNNSYRPRQQHQHLPVRQNDMFSQLFGQFGQTFDNPFFGNSGVSNFGFGFPQFGFEQPARNLNINLGDYVSDDFEYNPAFFMGPGDEYQQYGYGPGVDEGMIEEFLRDDPNEYGPPPASEEAINKLQNVKFNPNENSEVKACPICQENYKEGEPLLRLPCKHDYHGECVNAWLNKHNSCPMCRKSI